MNYLFLICHSLFLIPPISNHFYFLTKHLLIIINFVFSGLPIIDSNHHLLVSIFLNYFYHHRTLLFFALIIICKILFTFVILLFLVIIVRSRRVFFISLILILIIHLSVPMIKCYSRLIQDHLPF